MSEKFNYIINNFNPKDNNQLSDLKHLFNKYPYSQTISAYYLKSIKSQGVNNFSRILNDYCRGINKINRLRFVYNQMGIVFWYFAPIVFVRLETVIFSLSTNTRIQFS